MPGRTLERSPNPNEWLVGESLKMYTRVVRGYGYPTNEGFSKGFSAVVVALGSEAIGRTFEDYLAAEEVVDSILADDTKRARIFEQYADEEPLVLEEGVNPFDAVIADDFKSQSE